MKEILIAGNWKMNTNAFEAEKLAEFITGGYKKSCNNVQVLICPPFTNLQSVGKIVKGTDIALGAQNCHFKPNGAFTGEISIPMLTYLGCTYIITGHSERRAYFGEDDLLINQKATAILDAGLKAIVCIGETLAERQANKTFDVLTRQLEIGLKFNSTVDLNHIVVAYEPVWAIGTGIAATIEQIKTAHDFIRNKLIEVIGNEGKTTLIQYGGSVTAENAQSILALDNVHGALFGGASLKGEGFISIINTAQNL